MLDLPGYRVTDQVRSTREVDVFAGVRTSDDRTVTLKRYASDPGGPRGYARYEYEVLRSIEHAGVVRALDLHETHTGAILVLEHSEGTPLCSLSLPLSLDAFFDVADSLCSALSAVHRAGWIHGGLCPDVIALERGRHARIMHLDRASRLGMQTPRRVALSDAAFCFQAPEATGRLSRGCDIRSDLYSLGSLFYFLLAGVPPHFEEDPLEQLQVILTEATSALYRSHPEVSEELDELIRSLLAKHPSERPQDAETIAALLRNLREHETRTTSEQQLSAPSEIDVLEAHAHPKDAEESEQADEPRALLALAGSPELGAAELEVFEGVLRACTTAAQRANRGTSGTIWLENCSSRAARTLRDALGCSLVRDGARLVTARISAPHENRVYGSFVQIVEHIVEQLCAEGQRRFGRRRVELEQAMGSALPLASRIVPRLATLCSVPSLPSPLPRHIQRQLPAAMLQLIHELALLESPLILWLEGFEQADPESQALLDAVLEDPACDCLVVLVPLMDADADEPPASQREPLREQLRDRLRERVSPRAPSLEDFDLQRLSEALGAGPRPAREVTSTEAALLERACFLPEPFSRDDLQSTGLELTQMDLDRALRELGDAQLLRIGPLGIEFEEPARRARMQAEALAEPQCGHTLEWLRPLLDAERGTDSATGASPARIRAAEVCLALTGPELAQDHELERVREELRLIASRHALSLCAPRNVARYLDGLAPSGHGATANAGASEEHGDTLELRMIRVQATALLGVPEALEVELAALEASHPAPEVRAQIALLRIEGLLQDSPSAALDAALAALRSLGVPLRTRVSRLRNRFALWRLERRLLRGSREALVRSEETPTSDDSARDQLLSVVIRLSKSLSPSLHTHVLCRSILELIPAQRVAPAHAGLWLAHGALLLCTERAAFEAARTASARALLSCDRAPLGGLPEARLLATSQVQPWFGHPRIFLDDLQTLAKHCSQLRDFGGALQAWLARVHLLFAAGEPLSRLCRELARIRDFAERTGQKGLEQRAGAELGLLQHLTETGSELSDLNPTPVDEQSTPSPLLSYTTRLVLGDFHYILASEPPGPDNSREFADHTILSGLAAASELTLGHSGSTRACKKRLLEAYRRTRAWAEMGPESFEHQQLLLEAESLRMQRKPREATVVYTQALERADALGYVHHAAMICERQTSLWLDLNLAGEAARSLAAAQARFAEWGADAKVTRLSREYAELLPVMSKAAIAPPAAATEAAPRDLISSTISSTVTLSRTSTSTARTTQTLDLTTVLRSSEAIMGEVHLDRVLDRVLSIAIENAGAERSVLLLDSEGELSLNAEGSVAGTTLHVREPIPLSRADALVPHNLIQYVQRTLRTVVLGNASSEGLFADDPYIVKTRAKSILCLAVVRQNKLVGVLYLENALVSNAFTSERVEVLGLLSKQAAISLDNARLYFQLTNLNRDLEQRVEQRTEELREARDAAEAATRAKSEFLAVMSHEIRTPMNVVIGMAQLLAETPLSDDQQDCVQAVHTAGDSLLGIINDILDFSKIEAGKLDLETIAFSLRDCVEDVSEILWSKAREKGLSFPVFIDRRLPDTLRGDPGRLKQVVINFVNNAIKFTESGSVEIRVIPVEASGDTDPSRAGVRCEVRDTGIGIPEDRKDRLFQSFSQVDASTTRKYGGTGLGLAISKRLIEAMGGRVGVESEQGVGSTFWFEVHLENDGDPGEEHVLPEGIPPAWILGSNARVAAALAEHLATLGIESEPPRLQTTAGDRSHPLDLGRAVFAHFPFETPALRDQLLQLRAAGLRVFLIATVQDRPAAEPALTSLETLHPSDASSSDPSPDLHPIGLVGWPLKRRQLRSAVAQSYGVTIGRPLAQHAEVDESTKRARARFQILVAEDYVLNQKLATRLLARGGYTCDIVDDGQKVVEATASGSYDLVLMDCQMPVMDGFEATRTIRQRESHSGDHLPIIAMTANAMKGDRERCLEAGMDDYLSKPIRVDELFALLSKYLPDTA